MKHLFIINPAAGSRDRTKAYTETIEALCKGLDYRIEVSKAPGHCRDLAREAAESGEEYRIYACGVKPRRGQAPRPTLGEETR